MMQRGAIRMESLRDGWAFTSIDLGDLLLEP